MRRKAFTLTELLVVMAIAGILAAVSIPAVSSMMQSYHLTGSCQAILGQMTMARQEALSKNRSVQVRFYLCADKQGNKAYRAIQAFRENTDVAGNSDMVAVTKPYVLPEGMWIVFGGPNNNTTASTLLDTTVSGASSSTGDAEHPLPQPHGVCPYVSFRFRPNGRTDLIADSLVTVASERAPVAANDLPNNFITLRIDCVNGNVSVYQP